jgi:hypothetical protein
LGRDLDIVLDYLDPYRECHGLTSSYAQAAEEERRWRWLLSDGPAGNPWP